MRGNHKSANIVWFKGSPMLLMGKTKKVTINIGNQGNGHILTIATGDSPSDVYIPSVAPA